MNSEPMGQKVSKRPWRGAGRKFSSVTNLKKSRKSLNEKAAFKKMKELETKIKADLLNERKDEIRRIQQKRRFKEEQLLKEQQFQPLKQKKKSNGLNQHLRKKEWKKLKVAKEFNVSTKVL